MNPITRRDFLKASGSLVVSVSIPGAVATALSQGASAIGGKPPLLPNELDSWIAVLPDGSVTAFFGKMDMGQGVDVAIAQIVAEELDVAFEQGQRGHGRHRRHLQPGRRLRQHRHPAGGIALRNAAAEARRVLVELGSKKLGVPVERAHGRKRRGDGPGVAAARQLRRVDRRPAFPPQTRMEQAVTATRST